MGGKVSDLIDIESMSDNTLQNFLTQNAISLKISEVKSILELIGRNPTLTELHIFNIQWSEHSSYKSSRAVLKMLPTKAPNVTTFFTFPVYVSPTSGLATIPLIHAMALSIPSLLSQAISITPLLSTS